MQDTTTITVTSTLSTSSACYTTAAGGLTGGGCAKKKRSAIEVGAPEDIEMAWIDPSATLKKVEKRESERNYENDVETKMIESSPNESPSARQPRIFNNLFSTSSVTSTSTVTSITATTTFTIAGCTPASIAYSLCG